MKEKVRLDIAVHERGLAPSREKARGMIMAGEVMVNGMLSDKPGVRVSVADMITLRPRRRFVSRGGDKLNGALEDFHLNPTGLVCADLGASTGGFTDCLLQYGAARVYAIDVGYGILDLGLRNDSRVVVLERTNARYLEQLPEAVSWVVIDASFISLKLLLPVVKHWLMLPGEVIALIKPQFEAGREDVGKKGVVRDPAVHKRVLLEICTTAAREGYIVQGITLSPLRGPEGNVEFFGHFTLGSVSVNGLNPQEIKIHIDHLLSLLEENR